jgi:serine/threonine-protein kinase
VIHRDLKPENILLQHGEPVVSDFGIALAVSKAGGARVTQTGLSLGTPQYMSPEQATGDRVVDARSDIYSLGAVLYEMLTGEPPHAGKTAQAIIARVLTEKTQSTRLMRDTVPEHIDAAVLKALAKLPADRFASAAEFAAALKNPAFTGVSSTAGAHAGSAGSTTGAGRARGVRGWWSRARPTLPWAIAALALAALALAKFGPAPRPAPVVRFALDIPPEVGFVLASSPFAVSPDGATIVVGAPPQHSGGLFVQTLDNPALVPLQGTEGARGVFFAPDGNAIGFVQGGNIVQVPRLGGPVTKIASAAVEGDDAPTWGEGGNIVYPSTDGLWVVPATGGAAHRLTKVDSAAGERWHGTPHFLPGGEAVVFAIGRSGPSLAVVTLDGRVTRFEQRGALPRYVDDLSGGGRLLFDDFAGSVFAVPFDIGRLAITGSAVSVLQGMFLRRSDLGFWDVSRNGTLVQASGSTDGTLVSVSRTGVAEPLVAGARRYRRPRASPDGNRVVVEVDPNGLGSTMNGTVDLWMVNRTAETFTRFTFGAMSADPAWTRDGRRVAFARLAKDSAFDIYWQPADGSGSAEPLYEAPGSQWPYGFTPDGKTMLLDEKVGSAPTRIASVAVPGGKYAKPAMESDFINRLAELSPDGKWLAYTSTESGHTDVYIRAFPGPGGKWAVSNNGGDQVLWNPNGRELFYRDGATIIAVGVSTSPTFEVLKRTVLFNDRFALAGTLNWDVFPDGNHFVMVQPVDRNAKLVVTVNWFAELKRAAKR